MCYNKPSDIKWLIFIENNECGMNLKKYTCSVKLYTKYTVKFRLGNLSHCALNEDLELVVINTVSTFIVL